MNSTLLAQVKRKNISWSQKLSEGLTKPKQKFISDLIYGIQKSQSVILAENARNLEGKISVKQTQKRLSRQINQFEEFEILEKNYHTMIKPAFKEDSLVLVDDSDITKPYSHKLEHLKYTHDGSSGRIEKGYPTCNFSVVNSKFKHPIPIYSHLYATSELGFKSENDETIKGFETTRQLFGEKALTFVMDRGYDREIIIKQLCKQKEKFIVRLKDKRHLLASGKKESVATVANRRKGKLNFDAKVKGKLYHLRVSHIKVALPSLPKAKLYMVVVYGFGKNPMKLLTNRPLAGKEEVLNIVKSYLKRWRIEEQFRVIKQEYGLEKVRTFSLSAIRLIYKLVN
jgi:hypothetical protein